MAIENHAHCRCMNLGGQCPNKHFANCDVCKPNGNELRRQEDEKVNFMQMGPVIACGHCQPEKYATVVKCPCICHKEIVICAAIRMPDGYIVRGHRHSDAMRTASEIPRYKDDRPYSGDQGFVTSHNRYVNRVEGCQIQKAAGIKSVLTVMEDQYLHGELYSEDLY